MAGRISALQYRPNYGGDSVLGDFFGAQNAAMDSVDRFTRQRASKRAGQAMARGDYQAGANEFYDAGHLDAGSEVQNYGQAQEDRSATQAATARAQQQDQIKQRAELLSQVASGLKTVPMGQRKAQLDAISPVFTKVGLDTSMFGQLTEDDLTDAALDTFTGAVAKEVEFIKGSDGSYTAASKRTGLPLYQYQAPQQDEFKEIDPKKDLYRIPGDPGSGVGANAPRNVRNHNPGNIEDGEFAKSLPGYAGTDGRFAKFDTPEAGRNAQLALLGSYGSRGFNTIAKVINRWAPPSDNNPTEGYINFVAQRLGVDPNQPLNLQDRGVAGQLASAIEAFEGGGGSGGGSRAPQLVRQGVADEGEGDPPPGAGLTPLGGGFFRDNVGRTYQRNSAGVMQQSVGITDGAVEKTVSTVTGINGILAAIDKYEQAVRQLKRTEFSALGKYTGDPQKYAAAKAAATDLQMLLKGPDAYNLGVLTGPDLQILEGVVADPAKFDTLVRKNQIIPSLTQLGTSLGQKYAATKKGFEVLGGDPKALPDIYRSPRGKFGAGARGQQIASLPQAAVAQLKGGQITTFANGQRWTLRDGKPVQVQ